MSDELEGLGGLIEQGRPDLAEPLLRDYLAEDPDHPIAHSLLAVCRMYRKDWRGAWAALEEALRLGPEVAYVHFVRARWFAMQDRLRDAEGPAREALRLEPGDPDYHAQLAGLLFDLDRVAEAQEQAEAGLRHDPHHGVCANIRALCLMRRNRDAEAGRVLDGALRADPEDALAHVVRGELLLKDGRYERAGLHFREALRLDPTSEVARQGLLASIRALFPILGWPYRMRRVINYKTYAIGFVSIAIVAILVAAMAQVLPSGRWKGIVGAILLAVFFVPLLLTWLSSLVLSLHPRSRHLVSDSERAMTGYGTAFLGIAALAVAAGRLFGESGVAVLLLPAFAILLLVLIRSGAERT